MRPSDALGLGVRAKAPIYAENPVIKEGLVGEDGLSAALGGNLAELRSELCSGHQLNLIEGKAFSLGLSPEELTDTVHFRKDEAAGFVRMWIEADTEREIILDLNDWRTGIKMIFDLAGRGESTGYGSPYEVIRYRVHYSMHGTDVRARFVPEKTETKAR
jgi:bifunctional DNase/RNase